MTPAIAQSKPPSETQLQRALNSVLNDIPVDSALAAILHRENGPLVGHAARGFTARDVQAILRTLSAPALITAGAQDQDGGRTMRLRMITPGAKSLLGVPLRYRNRTYGFLVIGRKESAAFTKKERGLMDQASEDVTKALEREKLFDMNVVLSRPLVNQEQVSVAASSPPLLLSAPVSQLTPQLQENITALLTDAAETVSYDRSWVCHYDPIAGNVEVLGIAWPWTVRRPAGPFGIVNPGWTTTWRPPKAAFSIISSCSKIDSSHRWSFRFLSGDRSAVR